LPFAGDAWKADVAPHPAIPPFKVSGGSRGPCGKKPLIVRITPFTLFRLRLTTRFRDVNGSRFFLGGASCGFPRRKNVVTRTLRWSGVRMEQPGSATLRLLATAITERQMGGNTRSQGWLSVIVGLAEALRPEAFITSPVSHARSGAIAPMRRAMSGYCLQRQGVRDAAVVASPARAEREN
jgi:hypothetical protein